MGLLSAIKAFRRVATRRSRSRARPRFQYKPSVETLEARDVPVTNTWVGGTSAAWSTASNWSQGHVPASTENVSIPAGTSYNCDLGGTTAYIADLDVSGPLAIHGGLILASGDATNSGTITFYAGTIGVDNHNFVNTGTIRMEYEYAGNIVVDSGLAVINNGKIYVTFGYINYFENNGELRMEDPAAILNTTSIVFGSGSSIYLKIDTGSGDTAHIGATDGAILDGSVTFIPTSGITPNIHMEFVFLNATWGGGGFTSPDGDIDVNERTMHVDYNDPASIVLMKS